MSTSGFSDVRDQKDGDANGEPFDVMSCARAVPIDLVH